MNSNLFEQKLTFSIDAIELKLKLIAKDEGRIPHYSGSIFRGTIGMHLYELVCVRPQLKCEDCPFNKSCPYGSTFEAISKAIAPEYAAHMKYLPPPFVIEAPVFQDTRMKRGQEMELVLKLFGYAIDYVKYFIEAIRLSGKGGIGSDRICFDIVEIQQINSDICNELPQSQEGLSNYKNIFRTMTEGKNNKSLDELLLVFSTPLRVQESGRILRSLTKEVLISNCLRRADFLLSMYATSIDLPEKEELLKVIDMNTIFEKWEEVERYSSRQKKPVPLNGIIGTYSLRGDLSNFLPILELCSFAHIGKQTVFGLGKFKIYISHTL